LDLGENRAIEQIDPPCSIGPAVEWSRTYGGSEFDWGCYAQQTTDGGYVVAGFEEGNIPSIHLIKTDHNGNTLWNKIYDGVCGPSAQQTMDGGYIFAAAYYSNGSYDLYLVKTDSSGNMCGTRRMVEAVVNGHFPSG
jgi:hypothetical protein